MEKYCPRRDAGGRRRRVLEKEQNTRIATGEQAKSCDVPRTLFVHVIKRTSTIANCIVEMIRAFTFVLLLLLHVGHSFVVPFVPSAVSGRTRFSPSSASPSSSSLHAVLDIQSDQAFDKAIASADGLVVVDYR